jgi:hypothetical protein
VRDAHKIEGCALIDIKEIKAYTGLTTDNIILILNDMGIKAKIGPSGQKLYHPYALEIIDAALRVIGDNDDTESVLLRIFTEGRRTAQIIAIRNLLVVKGANYYTSKNLARRAIIDRLGGLCSNRLGVF